MSKQNELAQLADAVTVDDSNVGIGTSSPTAGFRTSIKGDYSSIIGGIELDSGGGDKFTIGHASATSPSGKLNVVGAGNLIMATNNAERMRIDSSGNVGIGTSSPLSPLDVVSSLSTTRAKVRNQSTGAAAILFQNSNTGAGNSDGLYIGHSSGMNYLWTYENEPLLFATDNLERMRIDSSGNFMVGQTSANATLEGFSVRRHGAIINTVDSQSALELRRTGTTPAGTIADFRYASSTVGTISVSTNSTSYNTSSDYRLKENVVNLTGASARVNQLNPSRFNFISDTDTTVDGFLAHEVADVVPEAITGTKDAMMDEEYEVTPAVEATYDEDGNELTAPVEAVMGTRSVPDYQGIDQSKLVPLLTAALQEALAEITSLKTRVQALEA